MQQFKLLKKTSGYRLETGKQIQFFLQLAFDETGAYLQTVNRKGEEIVVDSRQASGRRRDLIRALTVIQQRRNFQVDWHLQFSGNTVPPAHPLPCSASVIFWLMTLSMSLNRWEPDVS